MSEPLPNAADPKQSLVYQLADALLGDTITADEAERLRELISDDAEARRHYVRFMYGSALLRQWGEEEGSGFGVQGGQVVSGQWPVASDPPSAIPLIVVDSSPTLHSPVGSFVFSHIAAAVILGIGLLIGLAWRISLPTSERPEQGGTGYASAFPVGRITAVFDCHWQKQGSGVGGQGAGIPKTKDLRTKTVYLGDRFMLASGLMEVTYDTGAKVILQGPCTYEIDSNRGGFLAVGKLTAKVEKKAEGGRRRAENADHYQLPTTNYQLFAVRTPTATVTDLGTEFGVEVEESGATRSHVFQGSVEVRSSTSRRLTTSGESVEILHAGESARVERGRNRKVIITREPGQPDRFVRRITSSFIPPAASLNQSPSSLLLHPSSFAYCLTDLGTLGGPTSRAIAINAIGQIVGEADTVAGAKHAYLYADGKIKDLGTLNGGDSSASGINATGQIVGSSGKGDNDYRAFLFTSGAMKDLETLGGSNASAHDINDSGQIVGQAQDAKGTTRAFLYTGGAGMKDLGALGGALANSSANSINSAGLVVGHSETKPGMMYAFLYADSAGMKQMGTPNGRPSRAFRINDAGLTVGLSEAGNGMQNAVLYDGKMRMKILDGLSGNSFAFDINNAGQVVGGMVGVYHNHSAVHAFLHTDGKSIDLNSLIDSAAGWTLSTATAINDSGQIVGFGQAPDGNTRAFLLTPIREGRGAGDERRGIH